MTETTAQVRERPILFSAPMIRAILNGSKTQTRRVIKPQPKWDGHLWVYPPDADYSYGTTFVTDESMRDHLFHEVYGTHGTPYGSVYGDGTADTLWVRETWNAIFRRDDGMRVWWAETPKHLRTQTNSYGVVYRADMEPEAEPYPWAPSIFMPRWASRITLRITDVRAERVQEISEEDARAEGIEWTEDGPLHAHFLDPHFGGKNVPAWLNFRTAREAFAVLWDTINGDRPGCSWDDSPWVWVIEFERVQP